MGSRSFATKTEDFELIHDEEGWTRIEGYTEGGFVINGIEVEGSVLCYQDLFLLWNVDRWEEVNKDSLALVELVKPAPDVLLLGSGNRSEPPSQELKEWLRSKRLSYEIMDTPHAVSTYNVLAQEGRRVLAAVLSM